MVSCFIWGSSLWAFFGGWLGLVFLCVFCEEKHAGLVSYLTWNLSKLTWQWVKIFFPLFRPIIQISIADLARNYSWNVSYGYYSALCTGCSWIFPASFSCAYRSHKESDDFLDKPGKSLSKDHGYRYPAHR